MSRPIALLEESFELLRGAGTSILLPHWTGSIPFAATLLLLVQDARLGWSSPLVLRDSFFCAITFIWLSYWKSSASRETFKLLYPASDFAKPSIWLQAFFQTFKLFVLPFAAVSILAWPAASAFFRTLALEPQTDQRVIRSGIQRALTSATSGYRENLLAFLIIAALAIAMFVNVIAVFVALPILWKLLTGFETEWSTLGPSVISGLLLVAGVTTWIVIDPWIHTYVLLRVFYANARSDGRDLLRQITQLAAILLLCLLALPARAATNAAAKLDQSIDHVSQADEYGWLRPQATSHTENFVTAIAASIDKAITAAEAKIRKWLNHLLNTPEDSNNGKAEAAAPAISLRGTLAVVAVLLCGGIVALFVRRGRNRQASQTSESTATRTADILNEHLLPSDVNQEEWLRQALAYLGNNQTRLAARAFYLANLSYLGARSMLSLSLTKTNKLYERELARDPKARQLSPAFFTTNRLYERAWYGMRELDSEQTEALKGAADQLRQYA